jgi:transposase
MRRANRCRARSSRSIRRRPRLDPAAAAERALLLQAFYSIRSERHLVEHIDHDLLFRWFVGLGIEDPVWDASTFTKTATGCSEAT